MLRALKSKRFNKSTNTQNYCKIPNQLELLTTRKR